MIYKFNFIEKILLSKDIIPHPFADVGSNPILGKTLGVAVKLKITDHLGAQARSISQIAKAAAVSEKGTELVLDALTALGYAEKSEAGYCFSKRGERVLDRKSPHSMAWFIEFCDWTYNSTVNLEETIRNGKPSRINLDHFTDHEWEIFSRAMMEIAGTNVREVSSKIKLSPQAKSIIDLGGSHGLYSIELCRKYAGLTATILDLEPVRKYTEECVEKFNMNSRVSFQNCNFISDELPKDQDGALLFNIIHGFSPVQNQALFTKICQALKNGGQLVVLDQIKGTGGKSQLSQATTSFMAINLFHQANGNTYGYEEVKKWSESAGFKTAKLSKLNAPGFGLITCYK
ncbi:MAG: hypothetical protein IT233_00120 [Bacteroidia bacterium]|nr:hypothetical protein [Bacteroidia bacterium]